MNLLRGNKFFAAVLFYALFWCVYILMRTFVKEPAENPLSYTNNCFFVLSLRIPSNLEFCGEKIPFNDIEIRNDLEREFYSDAYWKANSRILFNKAQRWFPVIEPILKREGIPDDFKYLAVIESHLTNVTSPASAGGFWQLVPVTASNYGLEVSMQVDERYDVEKATVAACRHIRESYGVFRNWTLCAAAYNFGIAGTLNALARQKTDNYYDLMLNKETGSFVYRILAYKTLLSNPGHFGIHRKKMSYGPRLSFKTVTLDSSVRDLPALARHMGSDFATLRLFNPWILSTSLNNPARKSYVIRLPKPGVDYTGFLADVSPQRTTGDFAAKAETHADTLSAATTTVHYVVRVTEPVSRLAKFLNVQENDIRTWNKMGAADLAVAGQTLVLYLPKREEQ